MIWIIEVADLHASEHRAPFQGVQVQWHQVDALMRKSWAYQRKNIFSNVAVILSPIIIAIILGVLQTLLQRELDDDDRVCLPPAPSGPLGSKPRKRCTSRNVCCTRCTMAFG